MPPDGKSPFRAGATAGSTGKWVSTICTVLSGARTAKRSEVTDFGAAVAVGAGGGRVGEGAGLAVGAGGIVGVTRAIVGGTDVGVGCESPALLSN